MQKRSPLKALNLHSVKLQVIRIGKIAQPGLANIVSDYRKRLNAFIKTDEVEIKADANRDKRNPSKNSLQVFR